MTQLRDGILRCAVDGKDHRVKGLNLVIEFLGPIADLVSHCEDLTAEIAYTRYDGLIESLDASIERTICTCLDDFS